MSTTATGTAANNLAPGTILSVAKEFESLFDQNPSDNKQAKTNSATPTDQNTDEHDSGAEPTADESVENQEAQSQEDQDGDQATGEGDDSETQDEQQAAESTFTVNVDGKEEQIKQSELIAGYQRQASYTRKSQALAEDKKLVEQVAQQVRAEREHYLSALPKLAELLHADEPNWDSLRDSDPARFQAEWASHQLRKSRLAAVQEEQRRVSQLQEADSQRQQAQVLNEQRIALLNKLPSWRDEKIRIREATEMEAVMKSVGFTDAELSVYDHRALLLIRMASKYAASQAARGDLKKKAAAAPVVKPGSANATGSKKSGRVAEERFHKSGSREDAVELFKHFV